MIDRSRKDTKSFDATWSPTFSGTFHLKFASGWADYVGGMDINAIVVKTYTFVDTRTDTVTVTEQKPLIDFGNNFQYAIYGISASGALFWLVGLIGCLATKQKN